MALKSIINKKDIKCLPILTLDNGKTLYLQGDSINRDEAIEIAQEIIDLFCPPIGAFRVRPRVIYEAEPKHHTPCPHADSMEEAVDKATAAKHWKKEEMGSDEGSTY